MIQIRENRQKQLTSHYVDTQLLRTDLSTSICRMFVCVINMLWEKESAP